MKPSTKSNTEGQRLKALREELGATQDQIAELARLQRIAVVRAEANSVKWKSSNLREGFMRAYSMTYEQLSEYISGAMTMREAVRIASPRVLAALRRTEVARDQEKVLAEIFRKAGIHEELLQATKDAASVVFSEVGPNVSALQMIKQVLALNHAFRKHIDDTVRALRSDPASQK